MWNFEEISFEYCESLTSVTIPNSVTSIETGTFYYCESLTSVTIPNSVTSIGENPFFACNSLNKIIIDNKNFFFENNNLYSKEGGLITALNKSNITIPDYVTRIGDSAFSWCTSLSSINIPNSVTSIGDKAFFNCNNLGDITIPNSVTSIGAEAFDETAWYDNQPNGLVYAGKVVYKYKGTMPDYTSIDLAFGTRGIASAAFQDCSELSSVTIPTSVKSIGDCAFQNCNNLGDITIPNSVQSIGDCAFQNCQLRYIIIPNSVTSIGKMAFSECPLLGSVTISNPETIIGEDAFDNYTPGQKPIVPSQSMELIAFYAKEQIEDFEEGRLIVDTNNPIDRMVQINATTYRFEGDNTGEYYSSKIPVSKVEKRVYQMGQLSASILDNGKTFRSDNGKTLTITKLNLNGHHFYKSANSIDYAYERKYESFYILDCFDESGMHIGYGNIIPVKNGNLQLYVNGNELHYCIDDAADCRYRPYILGFLEDEWCGPESNDYVISHNNGKIFCKIENLDGMPDIYSVAYIPSLNAFYLDGELFYMQTYRPNRVIF